MDIGQFMVEKRGLHLDRFGTVKQQTALKALERLKNKFKLESKVLNLSKKILEKQMSE
jgi:hypothetical protein